MVGIEPLASNNITINNLSVSFGAIAGGITAGAYTVFLLAFNGLHIGAIATLVGQNNLAYVPEPLKYLVGMGLFALLLIYCRRKRV